MERIIHFCFLISAVVVLTIGLLLYGSVSQRHTSSVELHQISEIIDVAHRIRDNYAYTNRVAAERDIFGDPADLTKKRELLKNINADFTYLESLLRGDPYQLHRLQVLTSTFAKLSPTLGALPLTGQLTQENPIGTLQIQLRQDFFDQLSELEDGALHDLEELLKTSQDQLYTAQVKLASLIAIGLLLLITVYLYMLWQLRITKRLAARQKESDGLLRLAVDSVSGLIIYVDCNKRYKFCNRAYAQHVGRDNDAIVGVTVEQVLGEEVYKQVQPYIDRALAGQQVRLEHPLVINGCPLHFRSCLVPHVDNSGQVLGFFGELTDITELKHKESLLLEKTSFQKAILDSARISIITTDRDGIIQSFNVGAEKKLGYQAHELIGRTTPICLHDEQEIRERAHAMSIELGMPIEPGIGVLTTKASRSYVDEQEWTYLRKDGSTIPVILSITALHTEQNKIIGYLGIAIDITHQKQTEAELIRAHADAEAATRAKSAFLATMSHEIRTPMNGVLGMAEVLACGPLSQHQTEIVQTIRQSAGVLLRLIDDILDFSKIEAGRLELEKAPTCVREVAEGICTSLLPVAASSGVDLRLFISPEIPEQVWADDMRLRQVLYNLLGNAIKFSGNRPEQHGRVELRVEVAQAVPLKLVFRVIDNGIGIALEAQEGLFSAFTQAETSTTRRFGGTGLGLTICKRIVELAQGEIHVESTLGVGSIFVVTLPFTPAPGQAQPDLPDLNGLDCIVVGSPHINATDLGAYLAPQGAKVHIVANLAAAAKLVATMVTTAPVVIVHGAGRQSPLPHTLPEALKDTSHVRQLLLTRGRRRQARIEAPNVVSLDVDALPRHSFLHAVAATAGRASLGSMQSTARAESVVTAARPSIAEARAQGQLILVAEDNTINQKVILHQLGSLGYAAEVASTGAEALRMWRTGRYALLLTDLHMPELDGYDLASTIRAEESSVPRMPILALTANALRGESGHSKICGMDGYLTKPVQLNVLQKALRRWMPQDGATPANGSAMTGNAMAPDTAAVDVNVLKALVGGDETTVHELLVEFQAMSKQEAATLHQSFNAGDIAFTAAIAHKLKSSARSVGALALGDACAELENAGKAGHKDTVQRCILKFDAALAAVDAALNDLLTQHT